MFIRSAYNYDRRENSDSTAFVSEEATLAQQSFKDECDINVLVKRFGLTGEVPVGWRMPYYGDFTEAMSYQDMCDAVISADAAFMELPAELRDRFANDPQRLFDFLSSDKNRDELLDSALYSLRLLFRLLFLFHLFLLAVFKVVHLRPL